MAKYVHEIINPELFLFRPTESVPEAVLGILAMGITAAPVVSAEGKPIGVVSLRDLSGGVAEEIVSERMTQPVLVIDRNAEIEEAARRMSESDVHHLIAVDEKGRAIGVVSSLDVMRSLLAIPVRHPEAFPHIDSTGIVWSDPAVLDLDHAGFAPDGPGLLVLIHVEAGKSDFPVWAERASNVRARIHDLLSLPQTHSPHLARILDRDRPHLRFRAAFVSDPERLQRGLEQARGRVKEASLPHPKGLEP